MQGGVNEDRPERVDEKLQKLRKDRADGKESGEIDQEGLSNSLGLANGVYEHKYQRVDNKHLSLADKQTGNLANEVDLGSLRKSSSSEKLPGARFHSHENHLKDSHSNLLKSPECSRGRSRSRSIVREASVDDPYYRERKRRSVSDDERAVRDSKGYRRSSRDIRDKERERSSSSRYMERVEKHYSREDRDTYRDGSRERDWDRDRTREKERREDEMGSDRDRNRLRDRYRGEREQEMRENDRDWERGRDRERGSGRERERDRVREDRIRDRERDREGVRDARRARSRDKDRDNEIDRLSRRQKYDKDDGFHRDRVNDSRYRRNSEDYHRESVRRSDLENESSKDKQREQGIKNLERYMTF